MNPQVRMLVKLLFFIFKIVFFLGGVAFFLMGLFDVLNGKILKGIVVMAAGAAAVRLAVFFFTVDIG
jgi:hypothetical protein